MRHALLTTIRLTVLVTALVAGHGRAATAAPSCATFDAPGDLGGVKACGGIFKNILVQQSITQFLDPKEGFSGAAGDHYIHMRDLSGGSLGCGTGPYVGDWTAAADSGCGAICIDMRVFFDGCSHTGIPGCGGGFIPVTPFIFVQGHTGSGTSTNYYEAVFEASFTITDGKGPNPGWHRVCAPLAFLNSKDELPSNADGKWTDVYDLGTCDVSLGLSCANGPFPKVVPPLPWDAMLANIDVLFFRVDFTGNPAERVGYDNICVRDDFCTGKLRCTGCSVCNDPGLCAATVPCDPGVATCAASNGEFGTVTCAPSGPYAVGSTTVSATCNGTTEACTTEVKDCEPPTCTAPADLTLECNSPCGVDASDPAVQAFLAGATGSDNCGKLTIASTSPPLFPSGCPTTTPVVFQATDSAGYTSTCSADVTVVDTLPPVPFAALVPTAPLAPSSGHSAASVCTAPNSRLFQVQCGADDACDSAPSVNPVLQVMVQDASCTSWVEEVPVVCGELVEIRLAAPACAASSAGSPPTVATTDDRGIKIVTGERVVLQVSSVDACGNAATAIYDPSVQPSPLCEVTLPDGTCCAAIEPASSACATPCPAVAAWTP